jgi:hypothetical protein
MCRTALINKNLQTKKRQFILPRAEEPMRIVVYALRYEGSVWNDWEHECNENEARSVVDSANAKAFERAFTTIPIHIDILAGTRYIFERARGTLDNPAEGDTQVYGVNADGMILAQSAQLERRFARKYGRSERERERRSA